MTLTSKLPNPLRLNGQRLIHGWAWTFFITTLLTFGFQAGVWAARIGQIHPRPTGSDPWMEGIASLLSIPTWLVPSDFVSEHLMQLLAVNAIFWGALAGTLMRVLVRARRVSKP